MPVIEILNPQDPISEVKSVYTALKGVEVEVDLNEDSWARDYFIIFFHTGPNDPVSTSILRCSLHSLRNLLMSMLILLLVILMMIMMMLRSVDAVNETLPCKVKPNFVFCSKLKLKKIRLSASQWTPLPPSLTGLTPTPTSRSSTCP